MKLLFATTLLGLFATGAQADSTCGEYHIEDPGEEFTIECKHYACNVLELDANNNIEGRQGINPVGDGASCKINIHVYGDGGFWDMANHENTATIEHSGAASCDSASIGVSQAGLSASITCSVENEAFNTVEGNFQVRGEGSSPTTPKRSMQST